MPGLTRIPSYPMPTAHEVPAAVPGWRADPQRTVLLVHDMQEYFLRPFDATGSPRRELVANVRRLRERCAGLGVPIAYTAQPGSMTAEQRGLLADFWGPGMRLAEEDRAVVAAAAPAPGDWQFTKWRYSAFFATDLLARLRAAGRDQLVLCGVYAHLGVLASAMEAFSNDVETFLVADAVADFSAAQHLLALRTAAASCAVVRTTDQLVTELTAATAGAVR